MLGRACTRAQTSSMARVRTLLSPIHMHEAAIDVVQYAFMWMCSRPYGK